ncbi:outer membrane beta-barrel protein [Pedobacter sp. PWIIR3]
MNHFLKTTLILFICFSSATAQDNTRQFLKVINKITGNPIEGVLIEVIKNDFRFKTYSDSVGRFFLPRKYLNQDYTIRVTDNYFIELNINGASIKKQAGISSLIRLNPAIAMLKEVNITANRRYSDTMTIKLTDQHFERSVMVDDLFKNTNGLYKDSKGELYFKGKRVTDILIDGREFFGKNNLNVYKDFPALTLEDITIVETNIDSLSNATLTHPEVKLNFKLKEKFKRGRFGNLSVGIGSLKRYFFNTDTYFYNTHEQVSLIFGANNISPYSLAEPDVTFSSNGNDLNTYMPKLSYHNFINSHLELDILVTGKKQNKKYQSQSERNEENLDQFSSTKNISSSEMYSLEPSNVTLTYKIDPLKKIVLNGISSFKNELQIDSLQYMISNSNLNTNASLAKNMDSKGYSLLTNLEYEQRLKRKTGRYLKVSINHVIQSNKIEENNTILDIDDKNARRYDITGDRKLTDKKVVVSGVYNEPILSDGTLQVMVNYHSQNLVYQPGIYSVNSLSILDTSVFISYSNYQVGGKIRKNLESFSVDGSISGILSMRNIREQQNAFMKFLPNVNLLINHKIDKKNELNFQYEVTPNYPRPYQVTNINTAFDLVSLTRGNIYLNPEVRSQLGVTYNKRSSDLSNSSLSGRFEHYESKFGFKIDNVGDSNQVSYVDNMGKANAAQITLSTSNNLKSGNILVYNANIQYLETPITNRNKNYISTSMVYSQTGSLAITLFKRISITPTVNIAFNRQKYESSGSNIFMLSYSDKIAYSLGAFRISIYPLCNFSYAGDLNKSLSWAINGDIKLDIFKKNGTLWMKAYDIFNSFKYQNNYAGPSYIQTIKYSNLNRYILIGVSTKINNMK